jgi:superfamily II DNA or RNA helicase
MFCASIEHCKRFAEMLTVATNISCRQLSGLDRVERNRSLMEFASGRIQAVTAVDVLNEGIDVPDVNILVFLRSTHSRRIFVQQLGRGLRPNIGKDKLLVLDFVTDIRRLAEIIEMDQEAKSPTLSFQPRREEKIVTYFKDGIVTFVNTSAIPFTQQWLQDVADLDDTEEVQFLKFPEVL